MYGKAHCSCLSSSQQALLRSSVNSYQDPTCLALHDKMLSMLHSAPHKLSASSLVQSKLNPLQSILAPQKPTWFYRHGTTQAVWVGQALKKSEPSGCVLPQEDIS
jgi:hypothetical protein